MPPFDAISGAPNACQVLPNLVTSGQPTAEQLRAARAAGVQVVLDVRDPMEPRPFDEPALCRELGLEYVNIPITGPTMTTANLQKILDVVRANADRSLYYHCASGARVGASLVPYLVLDHQFEVNDAVDQAVRIGVRNPDYLEWAFAYLREQPQG
jgi:protein tyrosine phosphatase (PTP) superfamily phosphohydrolase (DUF442 family)